MKKIFLFIFLFSASLSKAQHTFSIVAVDSLTGEIGSAGATCLFFKDAALDISNIVLGVGAIHTQAWYNTDNQDAARVRMVAGDSPQEIITWLQNNDNGTNGGTIQDRQYGIVDLNNGSPRSAAYTGNDNSAEKGHRVGKGYSIQGNILISQDVLDDMESAYLSSTGPLCDRLMAVMQAAKRPGADSRCLDEGWSSGSAFIRVAKPTDTNSDFGNLWLDISVYTDSHLFTGDPIDEIQKQLDAFKNRTSIKNTLADKILVSPNPNNGSFTINTNDVSIDKVKVIDILGKTIFEDKLTSQQSKIKLKNVEDGIYFVYLYQNESSFITKKIVVKNKL